MSRHPRARARQGQDHLGSGARRSPLSRARVRRSRLPFAPYPRTAGLGSGGLAHFGPVAEGGGSGAWFALGRGILPILARSVTAGRRLARYPLPGRVCR